MLCCVPICYLCKIYLMKAYLLLAVAVFCSFTVSSQSILEWDPDYKLSLQDFNSVEIDPSSTLYSLTSPAGLDFSFYMTNYEFMFTKNFNSKVRCVFNTELAHITSPNEEISESLLAFAQYHFDLAELYTRKFRKEIFENKGAFSSVEFFQPIYTDINKEFATRHSQAGKLTEYGIKEAELHRLHLEVMEGIAALSDFCKSCPPPKVKKGKK